ncbi:hypothetical protein SPLC1_S171590 [Arthrospira platensis C1]|nr:hypothetical protein SPLC1_S171590 [Arthrospira platensis C1]
MAAFLELRLIIAPVKHYYQIGLANGGQVGAINESVKSPIFQ